MAWGRRAVARLLLGYLAAGLLIGPAASQPPAGGPAAGCGKPKPHYQPVVVIDPGHGGADPGAISIDGVYEKYITFAVATDLARLLRSTRSFRVALTRGADGYVPLRERVARALHADLLISIHADALPNREMRGLSVFTLSTKASDREAAALADRENRDVVAGVRLARHPREIGAILIDLVRRETDNRSRQLARDVVVSLSHDTPLLENPQRSAGFVVLTAPDIPSVLVELGCLSNAAEEKLLLRPSYRKRLARGLAHAIEAYFARHT